MRNEIHAPTKFLVDSKQSKKKKRFLKDFLPQSILFTYLLRPPLHKLGIFSLAEAGKEKQEFFRAHYISFLFYFFIFDYFDRFKLKVEENQREK